MLSYEITQDRIRFLKNFYSDCQRKWDLLLSFSEDKKNYIQQQSLVSNIGASTRIENAVLTDSEIAWINTEISTRQKESFSQIKKVVTDKLSKDKERSLEEVAGYRDALQIINQNAPSFFPLTESAICP
ncbi:MAG: hypothetical protein OMM_13610 [Candidatus Magnetoglobus multicellularis str. Araruama]|uniref:Uncharacterized protein n=1 Tax=Candidatus Magnetoglobus multicellularis str. Araruama TaxID=890399 RepID=A0A1V1NTP3_9BACT|nr:MAG: hypothetical protein OMM_13610 [Candidatus Magnetoglobus multicellularis str. Araruama]